MPDRHASSRAADERAAPVPNEPRTSVLLPLPLAGAYDYLAPPGTALQPGDFVAAPLGNNQFPGVVWGEAAGDVAAAKLKRISERLDAPPMTPSLRRLVDWVASYTITPPGAVLRMAMSVGDALYPQRALTGYALTERGRAALDAEPPLTPARQRVLVALAEGLPAPAADLARRAGCGAGVVRALAGLGLVETVALPSRLPRALPDWRRPGASLSPGAGGGRRRSRRQGKARRLHRHRARRRHRLGQDRGLFRRHRRGARARTAGAGAAAGDRAQRAVASGAMPSASAPSPRNGTAISAMPSGATPGAASPRARCRWWWVRARRSSCRFPISA